MGDDNNYPGAVAIGWSGRLFLAVRRGSSASVDHRLAITSEMWNSRGAYCDRHAHLRRSRQSLDPVHGLPLGPAIAV